MLIFVALGIVGLVAVMHHKAKTDAGDTGASNGVTIDAVTPNTTSPKFTPDIGRFGATGAPSPFTGLGAPGSNKEYKSLFFLQPNAGGVRYNALMHSPSVKGTGLLDPLPDKGTRSKQLVTKDVLVGPGRKV